MLWHSINFPQVLNGMLVLFPVNFINDFGHHKTNPYSVVPAFQ